MDIGRLLVESPESYRFTNITEHIDEVIVGMKADAEQAFCCEIDKYFIINLIKQ